MFGENLRIIMQAQKISNKELSKATSICESTISKFLSESQEPKFSQIMKIATALNLPPEVFMAVVNTNLDLESSFINEYYMINNIYSDKYSNMVTTVLYAFKEFVMDAKNIVDEDALYIMIILEGGTSSELGILRKGDYRVYKGSAIKNMKATIFKNTRTITFIIYDEGKSIPENWSQLIFEQLKPSEETIS